MFPQIKFWVDSHWYFPQMSSDSQTLMPNKYEPAMYRHRHVRPMANAVRPRPSLCPNTAAPTKAPNHFFFCSMACENNPTKK